MQLVRAINGSRSRPHTADGLLGNGSAGLIESIGQKSVAEWMTIQRLPFALLRTPNEEISRHRFENTLGSMGTAFFGRAKYQSRHVGGVRLNDRVKALTKHPFEQERISQRLVSKDVVFEWHRTILIAKDKGLGLQPSRHILHIGDGRATNAVSFGLFLFSEEIQRT